MKLFLFLVAVALVAACIPAAVAVKQGQDAEKEIACVTANWGQPVDVIAKKCTGSEMQLALDLIADVGVLLGVSGGLLPSLYATDSRIAERVRARRILFAADSAAPAAGPGPAPAGAPATK